MSEKSVEKEKDNNPTTEPRKRGRPRKSLADSLPAEPRLSCICPVCKSYYLRTKPPRYSTKIMMKDELDQLDPIIPVMGHELVRAVVGELYSEAPFFNPRNIDTIMDKLRHIIISSFTKTNGFFVKEERISNIEAMVHRFLMDIPEFVDLNLSNYEVKRGIKVTNSIRVRPGYGSESDLSQIGLYPWDTMFVDIDRAIRNISHEIIRRAKERITLLSNTDPVTGRTAGTYGIITKDILQAGPSFCQDPTSDKGDDTVKNSSIGDSRTGDATLFPPPASTAAPIPSMSMPIDNDRLVSQNIKAESSDRVVDSCIDKATAINALVFDSYDGTKSFVLVPGKVYAVTYRANYGNVGKVETVIGRLSRVEQKSVRELRTDTKNNFARGDFIIHMDCSENYKSNLKVIEGKSIQKIVDTDKCITLLLDSE